MDSKMLQGNLEFWTQKCETYHKIPMLLLDISEAHKEAEEKKARELEEKLEQKRQEVRGRARAGQPDMFRWTAGPAGPAGPLAQKASASFRQP